MLRLKALREEKGLLQSEVAAHFNISTSAIGMYEQGRRTPPPNLLAEMALFFDANIEYIMGRSDLRMRPSVYLATKTHDESLPEDYMAEKLLQSALSDQKGRDALKKLINENIINPECSTQDKALARSIGKMLTTDGKDVAKAKFELIQSIVEAKITTSELNVIANFLDYMKEKSPAQETQD